MGGENTTNHGGWNHLNGVVSSRILIIRAAPVQLTPLFNGLCLHCVVATTAHWAPVPKVVCAPMRVRNVVCCVPANVDLQHVGTPRNKALVVQLVIPTVLAPKNIPLVL